MLKLENTEVLGWEHAIRGMRNPMNSWEKSDSKFNLRTWWDGENGAQFSEKYNGFYIGPNDLDLMKRLRNAGTDHRKFMRMITVYVDITGPLYWWKEFDTYKVGTVANSCSTMHKIAAKEFTLEDFSCEHLERLPGYIGKYDSPYNYPSVMDHAITALNEARKMYLETKDKKYWWQMIQLLPSSYNQRRTVMLNYEVLANIYKSRKGHKLDEWREMCKWIERLPYAEIITGERNDGTEDDRKKANPILHAERDEKGNLLRGMRAKVPGIIDDSSDISEENVGSNDGLNKHFGGIEE